MMMMLLLWTKLCFFLLCLVGKASPQYTGCIDPANPNAKIKIGKKTTVCIMIGNSVSWNTGVQYTRVSFQPKADTYTRFLLKDSYSDLLVNSGGTIFNNKNITIGVASQSGLSFLRTYFNTRKRKIFPYLTAIIEVDKGVVQGITWDDACVFCGKGECQEITYDFNGKRQTQSSSGQPTQGCGLDQERECNVFLSSGDTRCDVTLYVVWTGTDASGKALQSSASRFSQFPAQELKDRLSRNLPELPSFGFDF